MDFGLGKRLTNLPALREIGYTANRRLLAVQRLSHDPIAGDSVLRSACDPVSHDNGTRVAGLRLTDPRALWGSRTRPLVLTWVSMRPARTR